METFQFILIILLVIALMALNERHKNEIDLIYEVCRKEREKLLDRIMSNNIHEYKSVSDQFPLKRSENGNYIVDQMEKVVKSKNIDWDV